VSEPFNPHCELLEALADRLPAIAWDRIPEPERKIESVAERMVSSLPTIFIGDPPVGSCYTTRGLATWRGVTRQAIHQQRRDSRALGFAYGRDILYPAIQFGDAGQTLPAVRDLLAQLTTQLTDAAKIAAWLDTVTPGSGLSPRRLLGTRPTAMIGQGVVPYLSQVTLVRRAPLRTPTHPPTVGT
jgi:hypothetical protein